MKRNTWLVAIVLKAWRPDFDKDHAYGPRTVDYVEVEATNEISARLCGYDVFKSKALSDQNLSCFMKKNNFGLRDIASAEAVQID